MKRIQTAGLTTLAITVSIATASAQAPTVGGQVEFLATPPTSVASGSPNTMSVQVFQEQNDLTLTSRVLVDIDRPGLYQSEASLPGGEVPAGERVDVYFFHQKTLGTDTYFPGWVEFPGEILGVLVLADGLNATDSPYGNSGTQYPSGPKRDLEFQEDELEVEANGRRLRVDFLTNEASDQIRVFVRAEAGTPYELYCFGDSGCPCGTDAVAGCQNSTGVGALLDVSGSTDIVADDLTIRLSDMPANRATVLFMGARRTNRLPLGEGFLCIEPGPLGAGYRRFPIRRSDISGELTFGNFVSFANSHVGTGSGQTITAGNSYSLQAIYRDPAGCTGSGFNLTNAAELNF